MRWSARNQHHASPIAVTRRIVNNQSLALSLVLKKEARLKAVINQYRARLPWSKPNLRTNETVLVLVVAQGNRAWTAAKSAAKPWKVSDVQTNQLYLSEKVEKSLNMWTTFGYDSNKESVHLVTSRTMIVFRRNVCATRTRFKHNWNQKLCNCRGCAFNRTLKLEAIISLSHDDNGRERNVKALDRLHYPMTT